jgi:hypothetical protein
MNASAGGSKGPEANIDTSSNTLYQIVSMVENLTSIIGGGMPLVLLLCKINLEDDVLSIDRVMWFNTKSISSVTVDHVISGRAEELMRSPGKYPPDAFV